MSYINDLAWIDYVNLCETLGADPAEQNEEFGYINRGIHRAGAHAVAAKVLRDLIALSNAAGDRHTAEQVGRFARIWGIDVTEAQP